jgi:hypothetical protein
VRGCIARVECGCVGCVYARWKRRGGELNVERDLIGVGLEQTLHCIPVMTEVGLLQVMQLQQEDAHELFL